MPARRPYSSGGHFIANASGDNFSNLATTSWVTNGPADLRFTVNFTSAASAPEPGSIALLALSGLPAVGVIARRRGHRLVNGRKSGVR